MRALVKAKPEQGLWLEDVPEPTIGPNDVLVEVHDADGRLGWRAGAPYDVILVTAAALDVPDELLAQLAPGGRMVLPIGPRGGVQELVVVHWSEDGTLRERSVLPVAFVPLV